MNWFRSLTGQHPTVCLTMMVRNEAHIIARCIERVRPFIDSYAIVDTGSTDDTVKVAQEALRGIPGAIRFWEWQDDFSAGRNQSLELADGRADYAFLVDADDIWEGELDKSKLREFAHSAWFLRPRSRFTTARFLKLRSGWRYEGVLHENPVRKGARDGEERPILDGIWVSSPNDGASWKDPEKYLKHARILGKALATDPTNTRNVFYLAQSFRDAGDFERAATIYRMRAAMGPGNFPEEVYVSLLEAGRCYLRLNRVPDAKACLSGAHSTYPGRREAMAELARVYAIEAATSPTVGTLNVEGVMGEVDEEPEAAPALPTDPNGRRRIVDGLAEMGIIDEEQAAELRAMAGQ